ncbi:MAG: SH3 domain-containing protein [Nitrospira sp.]|nr:SH3 domain-containing protein [Nitrospira sp.]MDR4476018.1 SH3 domain-containing protein [Nitrospira sp.]
MVSSMGIPAIGSERTDWRLLFATQPEPDLEFTEDDLDGAAPPPAPPMPEPKQSKKGPLLWILLLLLVGGIGYVAMDPDGAMQLIQPYLEGGAEPSPPVAQRPTPPVPKPVAVPTPAPLAAPAPAPKTIAPPAVVDSAPAPPPDKPAPTPIPAAAAPAPAPVAKPAPPTVRVPGPLFAESQRVTVVADPTRPKAPTPLFTDAVGSKTSTTVPAGATLTVLDGEYQKRGWVYSVRTRDGKKGWISERHLRLKR